MTHSKAHPGFAAISAGIASRRNPRTGHPYGADRSRAILAAAARNASHAAHKANPRLNRVRGK